MVENCQGTRFNVEQWDCFEVCSSKIDAGWLKAGRTAGLSLELGPSGCDVGEFRQNNSEHSGG